MWMNMALSIMSLQPRAITQTHSFSTNNSSSLRPEQEAINTSLPACVASAQVNLMEGPHIAAKPAVIVMTLIYTREDAPDLRSSPENPHSWVWFSFLLFSFLARTRLRSVLFFFVFLFLRLPFWLLTHFIHLPSSQVSASPVWASYILSHLNTLWLPWLQALSLLHRVAQSEIHPRSELK